MRTPFLTVIVAVGLIAFTAADRPAAAQQPAASADEARRPPDVTITGNRADFETKISGFVNQLTDFSYGDANRGLARWQDPVCPLVTGIKRDIAEYVLLRVSEIARAAGTPLAGEKCRHQNMFIVFTRKPEAYLLELQKRHGSDVFGGAAPILINEFVATPRPVRTWYNTEERTPEGLPLMNMSFPGVSQQNAVAVMGGSVTVPVRSNVNDSMLTNSWSQASHLVNNVVWAIKLVYVVVDPTRFKGVSLGQLADYVAMAGLAQIKLDPRLADDPTILTLFDKPPQTASPGVTEWDQAFLKSVYESEQKSVLERSAIAHDMVRAMAP